MKPITELFNVPEVLSPRLAWLKKHDVRTHKCPPDIDGDVSWLAWSGEVLPPECVYGESTTEADAIACFARNANIPLWNEEGFKK